MSSRTWTGLPADRYADLGDAERCGTRIFQSAPLRLSRGRMFAFAAMLSAAGLTAFQASRIYAADLGRHPPDDGEAAALVVVGALVIVVSLRIASWLSRRLADIAQTAPLIVRPGELLAGAPPRTVAFADIESIAAEPPPGLVARFTQAIYDRAFFLLGRAKTSIVRVVITGEPPLILDLDLLDGDPQRIERILSYRIAQAKADPAKP